jgi:hypothetical protein
MITKETTIDQITVTENNIILYREVVKIMEDDNELTKTYHRVSIYPGQDISHCPEKVIAICNTVWTPKVISSYQEQFNNV